MKRSELVFSALAVPLDFVALLGATIVAYELRFLPPVTAIRPVIFSLPFAAYLPWALGVAGLGVILFAVAGLYRITPSRRLGEEFSKIALACSTAVALVVGVMFFSRYLFDSRFIVLLAWALALVFTVLSRVVVRQAQRQLYRLGIGVHRIVLIGQGSVTADVEREFTRHPTRGYRVVKQFPAFTPLVAEELANMARNDKFDEVIQTAPNLRQEQTLAIVNLLQQHHRDYTYTADLLGTKVANFQLRIHAGVPLVAVKRTRLDGWGRIWKRLFDLAAATALLAVSAPVMAAVALAVWCDSGRPIFFAYQRVGEGGKPFRFIKFRSMAPGSHRLRYDPSFAAAHVNTRAGTPMIKFQNDPRVTSVGRVIRRWSLDELPQLWLVMRGTMSLVGPRPHEIEEVEQYATGQRQALAVKPGLTGLAQVSGRSDLDFNEEVKLDSFYVQRWSPWLDVQILLKTPAAIFRRRKAS